MYNYVQNIKISLKFNIHKCVPKNKKILTLKPNLQLKILSYIYIYIYIREAS